MNIKMATNSQLSTTESIKKKNPKQNKKLSKQLEQEQNHRNGDHMEGYHQGKGEEEKGGKGAGKKKHKWQVQNRQEEVKNSMGNGEAKELIYTTHGHELRQGMLEEMGVLSRGG